MQYSGTREGWLGGDGEAEGSAETRVMLCQRIAVGVLGWRNGTATLLTLFLPLLHGCRCL